MYLVLICVKRFPLYLRIGRIQSQYKGEIASMNTKGGCFLCSDWEDIWQNSDWKGTKDNDKQRVRNALSLNGDMLFPPQCYSKLRAECVRKHLKNKSNAIGIRVLKRCVWKNKKRWVEGGLKSERSILKWFSPVEKMNEDWIYRANAQQKSGCV